jgi:hypothetical protein
MRHGCGHDDGRPRDGREISANPQEILPSMEYVYSDPQASHVHLVLNQVLLAGNEFTVQVPPLSHKQISHLLRIAVMGIACALAQHARSSAVSGRLPLVATTCRKILVH